MRQTDFTYQQLFRVLRAFGFRRRLKRCDPPTRYFAHESGALLTFPRLPRQEGVWEYHLVVVRVTLSNWGIAEPEDFDHELQKSRRSVRSENPK
jgi:hypothetical protein